jgi:transposase-like protein
MNAAELASIGPETGVTEKAKRRVFPGEYKRSIVKAAEACKAPGEVGRLLRREGLYSSHLTTWRAARDRGELAAGATAKKRGPQTTVPDPRDKQAWSAARRAHACFRRRRPRWWSRAADRPRSEAAAPEPTRQ